MRLLLLLVASAVLVLAWWVPNRPQLADLPMPAGKLASISFEPYRVGESPLTGHFSSAAEVDQDLGLIAERARGIRSYSAHEGNYDLPALARKHGLKLWQGIWLGHDRAANAREMAAAIAAANAYPDVITRLVVGNEVLLRHDLPVDELIADIDQVKAAVHQPVTYADVWNFFVDNPQVVPHLDVVTVHILPYWEDHPTNIPGVIAHVRDVLAVLRARFPGKQIAIGETGWPSRGRWRQDAAPSVVNEATYLRRFVALAQAEGLDYNFFEGFDEVWKYHDEGVVGPSWGMWTTDRMSKFPLNGPVQEDARWPVPAGLSVACCWLLFLLGTARRVLAVRKLLALAVVAATLGWGLGVAWAGAAFVLFSPFVLLAAIGNLAGQAVLAFLFVQFMAEFHATGRRRPTRSGRDATLAARALLKLRRPQGWQGGAWKQAVLDDLAFLFVWTAAVLQLLLLLDGRYRDFPLPTLAVPVLVVLARIFLLGLPRNGGAREEWAVGLVLALAAVAGAALEGVRNTQSLEWCGCALILAAPPLLRVIRPRRPHGA